MRTNRWWSFLPSRKNGPAARPRPPLRLEPLESRLAPAVTASLSSGTLSVHLGAFGDTANITISGASITVDDGTTTLLSAPTAAVQNIASTTGAFGHVPGTTVNLNGTGPLGYSLSSLNLAAAAVNISQTVSTSGGITLDATNTSTTSTINVGPGASLFAGGAVSLTTGTGLGSDGGTITINGAYIESDGSGITFTTGNGSSAVGDLRLVGAVNIGFGSPATTDVTFNTPVDGGTMLGVAAAGTITFAYPIGAATPVGTFNAQGVTRVGDATSSDSISFNAAVSLLGDATLTAPHGVFFSNSLSGNSHSLTLGSASSPTDVTLNGPATGLANLQVFGTTNLVGTAVTTSGAQTYRGPFQFYNNGTVLTGTSVTFQARVESPTFVDLTVNASAAGTFGGDVGDTSALSGLTLEGGASYAFAGSVTLETGGSLLLENTGGPSSVAGVIAGDGAGLVMNSPAIWVLSGNNTYNGTTTIDQGVLEIDGSQPASPVTLAGGTLAGRGVTGPVSADAAVLGPGPAGGGTAVFGTGDLTLDGSTTLTLDLNGTARGSA